MTAIADITINDGESTPVAHVFTPDFASKGLAAWRNRSGGVPVGFEELAISDNGLTSKSDVDRVAVKLKLPVTAVNADTGIDELMYTLEFHGTYIVPKLSTTQQRDNLHTLAVAAASNAFVQGAVVNRDPITG